MNGYGRGRTTNNPARPRTAIRPVFRGSQEKPMRGSTLCKVGFANNGPTLAQSGSDVPQTDSASVRFRKLTRRPLVSVITVAISERKPSFKLELGFPRQ